MQYILPINKNSNFFLDNYQLNHHKCNSLKMPVAWSLDKSQPVKTREDN